MRVSLLDWGVFLAFLTWIVVDGIRRSRRDGGATDHFLAGRSAPWWVIGLSILATQASAITMVGTTGVGAQEGMRFVQFYYALPIAMLLLALFALPLYQRAGVFTVYEYLGRRFDQKTRLLSALTFLVLRGLSVAFVIYAPSIILSAVLDLPATPTIIGMGGLAIVYTSIGGMRAVLATDVKQMGAMVIGLAVAMITLIRAIPEEVGVDGVIRLADATGRWVFADWSFDPSEKYTIGSSLIGGTLLFLAYFGCDQSQAQRYLSGKSLRHGQGALFLNAIVKVPFQMLILTTGILLFGYYSLEAPPESFVPQHRNHLEAVDGERRAAERAWREARGAAISYLELDSERAREKYVEAQEESEAARGELVKALQVEAGDQVGEKNYIFPYFILHGLPRGLIGLLIAAIFAAALSSIDSELNAMSTVVVMDILPGGRARRLSPTGEKIRAALALVACGAFATSFAIYVQGEESIVEAVNKVGSLFYGALLGVFLLAVATRRVNGTGAVVGLIAGVAAVPIVESILAGQGQDLPFLYRNTIGTVTTVTLGLIVSHFTRTKPEPAAA